MSDQLTPKATGEQVNKAITDTFATIKSIVGGIAVTLATIIIVVDDTKLTLRIAVGVFVALSFHRLFFGK